jgi:aryl-alcohol dehydrogenase-like predicted oxidoreductase
MPAVEYRELGKTGEKISTIGMGTWRVGLYASPEEKARQVAALRRGVQLGITHIDTAEMYHGGKSEELVGEAVRDFRKDVFIATKVSPDHLSRSAVISACEGSLKRLGTSYIDLYQVHWPNPKIPVRETMAAMQELVNAGKIRFVGVSNFSPQETDEARAALPRSDVASNQVEYSLASRGAEEDVLPYCSREGLTLIAYSPLNRGHISDAAIPRGLLEKYSMSPAQAALNWVTREENVVAIPKAATVSHVEENAASVSKRFSATEYRQISGL